MKNYLPLLLIGLVLTGLVGCSCPTITPSSTPISQPTSIPTGQPTIVPTETSLGGDQAPGFTQSSKARVMALDVPASDQAELVGGNSAFAFDLYRLLKEEEKGNLFYSPHSISLALAMTYAGARGETEQQMADALHYILPQDHLHPAFNWLDLELASRGEGAEGKDDGGFRLNVANSTWGQKDHTFLPDYLDTLALNYGAGMQLVDFVGDPEGARGAINDWVSDKTEGKIKDIVPPGAIDELTRLVLANAIYFNAAWAEPFEESQTKDGPFYPLDGDQVTVPMMHQTASFGYAEGEGYQAVELPYDGRELSMVILLPAEDEFESFEDSLDAGRVDAITSDLAYGRVILTMPRFEVESSFSLGDALSKMGMPDAFSMDADFSGIDGMRDLYIGAVVHKAFVSVDEAGTEAAAATIVIMPAMTAQEPETIEVTIDHPFIFFIRDIKTGAILFVGRVVDPGP
ncbi:MAG: serpin family protein [Anaerolineae bacterium]|jgi:serpin B